MKKLLKMIYLSDWFDPFYNLYNLPFRIYLFITKFFYYGYIGASNCFDFDAHSIHILIYAHIKRVNKYMKSSKTHLEWNNDENNKNMRRLAEFTELSRRMKSCEMKDFYFFTKVLDDYRSHEFFNRIKDINYKKRAKVALKKDQMKTDQLTKRYYAMLEKYVPGFWD